MYCRQCGRELPEGANACPNCGTFVNEKPKAQQTSPEDNKSVLRIVAKILMILDTIAFGFMILPLAWMIPMTVHYFSETKKGGDVSIAFKICCLLFGFFLPGILMLVEEGISK